MTSNLFYVPSDGVPNIMSDEIHSDRPQFVFHISDGKNHHFFVYVHIGRLIDEARPGAFGVFGHSLGQRFPAFHTGQNQFQIGQSRRNGTGKISLGVMSFEA